MSKNTRLIIQNDLKRNYTPLQGALLSMYKKHDQAVNIAAEMQMLRLADTSAIMQQSRNDNSGQVSFM